MLTPPADPGGLVSKLNAGILSSETAEGIAKAIERAVKTPSKEREEIQNKAKSLVSDEMSWQKIARTVEAGYRMHLGS